MLKQSSKHIEVKLEYALSTVGDMALKRRAKSVVEGLDLEDRDKVLEIGCGNGYYLSLLNRLGMNLNLVGVDNDKMALSDAKKFIDDDRVKLILADAERLPFKDKSFDKIVMSEVIEHVNDEDLVLKETLRVLKPGGILTLTTCNIDYPFFWDPINWVLQHLFNTHIRRGFWAGIWNQHERMYKQEDIEKMIRKARFKINRAEVLTGWCLPFNHYIVNFIAKLFYANKLPKGLAKGMNKFQNYKQPIIIKLGFRLINLFDRLNDLFPQKNGVSIFIKAGK